MLARCHRAGRGPLWRTLCAVRAGAAVPFLAKDDTGKDTGAAAQAALDPGATRTRIEQEMARLPERLERAPCEPVT